MFDATFGAAEGFGGEGEEERVVGGDADNGAREVRQERNNARANGRSLEGNELVKRTKKIKWTSEIVEIS